MISINPYLNFNGTCEQAFNFYKSAFGGEFEVLSRFHEMPENPDCKVPDDDKDKVMHVSLPISEGNVLMGSDTSQAFGQNADPGNNFSISINTDSIEEAKRLFNQLSDSGVIKMPLDKTFWNSYFGMFTDKFGIHWMINCDISHAE
jgi:PhnB protein